MNADTKAKPMRGGPPTVTIVHATLSGMWACEKCVEAMGKPWSLRGRETAADVVAWWASENSIPKPTSDRLRGRWVALDGTGSYDDGPCEVCAGDEIGGHRFPVALVIGRGR